MGTFVKSYNIGHATYELYAMHEDDVVSYDLVDELGRVVAESLNEVPGEDELVRMIGETFDDAA
jgi:hypothetical protein